jgi:hypothetical protein
VLDFAITMDLVLKKTFQNRWSTGKNQVTKITEELSIT